MKNKIEVGDLKAKVAYSFQQPYTRNFGFRKTVIKHYAKEVFRHDARAIATATPYLLENELLEVICTAVNKKKLRQFIDAFWRARPPNHNFFIEWDAVFANNMFNLLENEIADLKASYKAALEDQQVNKQNVDKYKGLIVPDIMGVSSIYKRFPKEQMWDSKENTEFEAISPSKQEYQFHWASHFSSHVYSSPATMSIYEQDALEKWKSAIPKYKHKIPTESYNRMLGEHLPQSNGFLFLKKWLDLANTTLSTQQSIDIEEVGHTMAIGPHRCHHALDADRLQKEQRPTESKSLDFYCNPEKLLIGHEKQAFFIMISAISMLNYDWVVNKEAGVIARGSKSVNTEVLPQDLYKRVTINLPKDKAVKEFMKPMPRTRKFGTAEHSVRGHWRVYKKTGIRVWIKEHHRGDSKYGTVTKDYVLAKKPGFLKQANTLEPSSTIH